MTEYIDRSQLIQRIKQEPTDGMYTEEILSAIDEIEAADVAEVRHGKNVTHINPVDEFICSDCGFRCGDYSEIIYEEDGDYEYSRECVFNYCPNCGAKMDLGDDKE